MKKLILLAFAVILLSISVSAQDCKIDVASRNVGEFLNEVSEIDAQLKKCPQTMPFGSGFLLPNGDNILEVKMNSGETESIILTRSSGKVTGVKKGTAICKQKFKVGEADLNTALASQDVAKSFAWMFARKQIDVEGCNFFSKLKNLFAKPAAKYFAKKNVKEKPEPKPDCGYVGEQCDNRKCYSGTCAVQKGQSYGYKCISQSEYSSKCQARGNSPAAYDCQTAACPGVPRTDRAAPGFQIQPQQPTTGTGIIPTTPSGKDVPKGMQMCTFRRGILPIHTANYINANNFCRSKLGATGAIIAGSLYALNYDNSKFDCVVRCSTMTITHCPETNSPPVKNC